MAHYILDVENSTGTEKGTVIPDVGWRWNWNLNQVNEAELKFSGTGEFKRGLLKIGSKLYIYKNSVLVFKGLIDNTDYFVVGTVVFHASGEEVWLAKENGDYLNSPWIGEDSEDIFADIIAESNYLNAGTIVTGLNIDYRLNISQSLWNGVSNLANKTSQDVVIDYTAIPLPTIGIANHIGSTTSVAVLNEGKEITNLQRSEGYPRGNKIEVFGKGDGDNQIKGTAQDATSIAAYGEITKTIIDRSIISEDEADAMADAELALNKDPPNVYDFNLTNPDYGSLSLGDVITLNALDQDVVNEDVRIVGIEEGDRGGEAYISIQTTNPELKTLMRNKNKVLAKIMKEQSDEVTYMQGSGNANTWGGGINAKTSYPLKVGFYLPTSYIQDEAGNSNIKEFTVSYDIDGFKQQFGTASFDGSDPQVQNDSASTAPTVSGSSSSTITIGSQGSDTFTENVSTTWDLIMSEAISGTFGIVYVDIEIEHDGWSGTDTWGLEIRLDSTVKVTLLDLQYGSANGPYKITVPVPILASTTGTIYAYMYSAGAQDYQGSMTVYATEYAHTHGDGTYAAANHPHADGTYDINAADIDNISISDDVTEAGSPNATSVNLYLDFWNGASWVLKNSILNTGKTIDQDVDISSSGTYPDAAGWWRVRVEPITASADFAQGIVQIKNAIDN